MPELLFSLSQVPKGSAPGPSGITAELLRLLPYDMVAILLRILNLSIGWQVLPVDFLEANI